MNEDKKAIKWFRKRRKENPDFRFFVASKRGGNARGKGQNRSVILATIDGKTWYQADKIWGFNNEQRAKEIVKQAML